MKKIWCVPADVSGNKLWLRNYENKDGRHYIDYASTYNDIPFRRTEVWDVNGNFVITSDDGTVLYRFPIGFLQR